MTEKVAVANNTATATKAASNTAEPINLQVSKKKRTDANGVAIAAGRKGDDDGDRKRRRGRRVTKKNR